MHGFAVGAGLLCIVAWFYLLLGHGRFWMVRRLHAPALPPQEFRGNIAVVIPARNEAHGIRRAVRSLLDQQLSGGLQVYVVDDDSSDGTAEVARAAALSTARPDALTVITGQPLPRGWTGKLWAVQQGIERALQSRPDYLLLTDADVEHSPTNIATLVAIADGAGYDLVSFMVKLHSVTLAEKLLIPAFVFFFFMLYPPEWIRSAARRTAGAAGGCMLIRSEALKRAGGIAAIRREIIDDCALARVVKRSGGRVWLGLTPGTHSLREYATFREVEAMIARTAFNQLHHSAALLAGSIVGMGFVYLLPFALLLSGSRWLTVMGGSTYLLMLTAYLPMVRFYGLNPLWALSLPFSASFYLIATVHSALKFWSGRGGEWKGRAQDVAGSS